MMSFFRVLRIYYSGDASANVEGFGGMGAELVSKFGLRITDEATFIVSVNRWGEVDAANPQLPDRPKRVISFTIP